MRVTREILRLGKPHLALLAAAVAACLLPAAASAEEVVDATESISASSDLEGRVTAEERPFAFLVDPSTPSAGMFSFGYDAGLGSGVSADRPIPVVLQQAGVSNIFSVGYGATSWLEPIASLNVNVNTSNSNSNTTASGVLGLKFQLTAPDSPWRAAVLGGALREGQSSSFGTWVRATGSYTTGPLLLEANGYAEHIFQTGRDAVDFIGMLGGSYRVLPGFRVGAEYVGQDLEETFDAEAEGGARMGVGPDIAIDLDRGRFQIVLAALFGVTSISPTAVARAGLVGSF